MSDANDEKIIFDIWPRTPKKGCVSYKVMMYDIANQVAITLYDKRLTDCLGTAQNVRSKKLKHYDVRVHVPRNPTCQNVKTKKIPKKTKTISGSKYTKKSTYSARKDDCEVERIRGYIFSMIAHGKRSGVQIHTIKINA